MKVNDKGYRYKSTPFYEEDEKGLVLCDDFIIDEFDEEFLVDSEQPKRRIDEGSIKVLTVDEIKSMKTSKQAKKDDHGDLMDELNSYLAGSKESASTQDANSLLNELDDALQNDDSDDGDNLLQL